MYKAENKTVTVGGREIDLSTCSQEQLAKLAPLFPKIIKNDLPKPQRSKPNDQPDAEWG